MQINLIYFDIIYTERWLPHFLKQIKMPLVEETPLNDYFDLNGYKAITSISNLGSTLIYISLYLALAII